MSLDAPGPRTPLVEAWTLTALTTAPAAVAAVGVVVLPSNWAVALGLAGFGVVLILTLTLVPGGRYGGCVVGLAGMFLFVMVVTSVPRLVLAGRGRHVAVTVADMWTDSHRHYHYILARADGQVVDSDWKLTSHTYRVGDRFDLLVDPWHRVAPMSAGVVDELATPVTMLTIAVVATVALAMAFGATHPRRQPARLRRPRPLSEFNSDWADGAGTRQAAGWRGHKTLRRRRFRDRT
jgi:hypothetical protein